MTPPAYQHPKKEEKEAYVQALFDQIAEKYDQMNLVISAGQWKSWHREFVRYTGLQPGMKSLDVACGTGDLSMLTAAQVAPSGSVIGVDFSEGMLAVGRQRVAQSPWGKQIDLRRGNAMDLEFADNTFDCVTMGWAMRNVKDIPRVLSEMYRVLKPGGRVVVLEASKPPSFLVRFGFFLYWRTYIPLIDWLVIKAGRNAKIRPYTYLAHSLDDYPFPEPLRKMYAAAGFAETDYKLLMLGSAAIHYGVKPVP